MRGMGWSGGGVPCKSRHWLLASSFWHGDKDLSVLPKITARPVQREDKQRKITASPSQICRISLSILGGTIRSPGNGVGLLGRASEETWCCSFPLALATAPAHADGIYPRWWRRAWCPCQDQSQLVRCAALVSRTCSVTSAATYRSNPSKGKWFEIKQTGKWLPKGMKIILFHA